MIGRLIFSTLSCNSASLHSNLRTLFQKLPPLDDYSFVILLYIIGAIGISIPLKNLAEGKMMITYPIDSFLPISFGQLLFLPTHDKNHRMFSP